MSAAELEVEVAVLNGKLEGLAWAKEAEAGEASTPFADC
jgi:hypothetical protein